MNGEIMNQTTPHEHIIRQRGGLSTQPNTRGLDENGVYVPYESEPFIYGFLLVQTSGQTDRFAYASLGDIEYRKEHYGEYISFTHCAKAVTIKGTSLFPLIELMNGHTLSTLYQHDGTAPYHGSKPLVVDVKVTFLSR